MQSAAIVIIEVPFEERLQHIIRQYGAGGRDKLINAITRIKKRLGPNDTKAATAHLADNNIHECFTILLKYYDKCYSKSESTSQDQSKRKIVKLQLDCPGDESIVNILSTKHENIFS